MTRRVFIIEDGEWLREMLAQYLGIQPHLEVCGTAASAEEALRMLPAGADAVTVDLGLEGEPSGLDLLRILHRRWPDLPCVVLSGQTVLEMGAAAREAGAAAYVEKGDEEHLVEVLYDLLGLSRSLLS